MEEQLVDQLVCILLRAKRAPAFEAELFNWQRNKDIKLERDSVMPYGEDLIRFREGEDAEINIPEPALGKTIAALLDKDFLGKVMRYESALQGRLRFTLDQLHNLRARRRAEAREDGNQGPHLSG